MHKGVNSSWLRSRSTGLVMFSGRWMWHEGIEFGIYSIKPDGSHPKMMNHIPGWLWSTGVSKVCAPQCPEFNSYLQDDSKSIRPVIDTQLTSMLDVTFATIVNIESNFCGQYHIFHLWYMPNMKGKFKQCKMFTMRTFGSVCALHAHGLLVRKIPKMSGYTRNVCEMC